MWSASVDMFEILEARVDCKGFRGIRKKIRQASVATASQETG